MTSIRRRAVLAWAFLLILASPAAAIDTGIETFTLANGMQAVVIPDHRAPVVTHMVWYKVGSADEPDGKAGIAHFLEHLMFKGTKRYPPGAFSRIIRKNGGEENAFTSKDYTGYYQTIAKDRLDLVMDLEADRMQNLILENNNVLPELEVVKEERRERTDNEPSALLAEQVDAASYLVHPYRKPVIGWMNEVAKLTRQDAIDFYRAHYTPSNAILVVAGDVTTAEVKALAEKHYGVLKNTFELKPRVRAVEPEQIAARRVTLEDARVAAPSVQRGYLAPSYASGPHRETVSLDVLAEILGGGSTSRLYQKLVVEQKVASYAGAWYNGDNLDWGSFGVYAAPNPGGGIAAVEAALDVALAEMLKDGVTAEEVARAKSALAADIVYTRDNQGRLARLFGTALTSGLTVADVLAYPKELESVTRDDVMAAAKATLDLRRSVTGVLLPPPGAPPTGAPPEPPVIDTTTQN
ncbi:pitrilysin family protein [soil metagenome]